MAASALVQAWLIERAIVPAQDAVRYVAAAQAIEREGLASALRPHGEQPLFPCCIWATHRILTTLNLLRPADWGLCAQIAAAAPLVLATPLAYGLLRRLVGPRAGLVGGACFVFLPSLARLGADGLSDGVHLAWSVAAARAAVQYCTLPRVDPDSPGGTLHGWPWLLACGACAGVAMWARSESLALPLATLAAIVVAKGSAKTRLWRAATAGGALALGFALTVGPYLAAGGTWRPREIVARLLGGQREDELCPLNDPATEVATATVAAPARRWTFPDGRAMSFSRKDPAQRTRRPGLAPALGQLAVESVAALQAVGLALFACGWRQGRGRRPAARAWFVAYAACHLAGAIFIAATRGYLSQRHLLPLAVPALAWVGQGALAAADAFRGWARRSPCFTLGAAWSWRQSRSRTVWQPGAVCATLAALCAPGLARPLHASHLGHRQAASWVRGHVASDESVLDTRGWTALYSGRTTYRYELAKTAFVDPRLAYLVLEQAELTSDSPRGETLRWLIDKSAEEVGRFPAGKSSAGQVVVYRWRPRHFAQTRIAQHAR